LKLDLHTHCREATACPDPSPAIVQRIISAVKARGLDGIAVTEHYTESYGYAVKEIVHRYFNDEIIVIPGKEVDRVFLGIDKGVFHVVELYLPCGVTFRFVAHPGHPQVKNLGAYIDGNIHGIEIGNPSHDREMDRATITDLAEMHDLVLLTNSDAHSLEDIGVYHNEISIELLCERASRLVPSMLSHET